jgi:hypothetical protein
MLLVFGGLVLVLVLYVFLSWVIEGAVRRGVSKALQDNRYWLSGQRDSDWLSGPRAPG